MKRKLQSLLPHQLFASVFLMLLNIASLKAQEPAENVMIGPENEVVMKVSRENGQIVISVFVNDTLTFDYISVERKPDYDQNFTQCKYISYSDFKQSPKHVTRKDTYPYPATSDVFYRLRLVTKDGGMRTYASVRLRRLHDK